MLKCSKCLHRLWKSWGHSNFFGCNLNALYAHHCSPISPLQTSQRRSKEHFQRLQDRWLRCQHTWSRIQSRARSPQWILPGNPKAVRFIVFSTSFYLRHLPVYPIRWISNSKYHMAMLAGCFLKLPTMAEFDVEKTWEKKNNALHDTWPCWALRSGFSCLLWSPLGAKMARLSPAKGQMHEWLKHVN